MSEEVNIDLSNYKDRVGNRVLPGRYHVIVEDAEMDKSQAGNQMINLWLRVQGGEFNGAVLVDRLTLTEKALFRVVGFMQAIGMQTPKKRLRVNIGTFINKGLDVDVDDGEPYNGRVKSEIRGYLRPVRGESNGTAAVADLPADLEEFGGAEPPADESVPDEVDLNTLDL
jgi:hypothetical protein